MIAQLPTASVHTPAAALRPCHVSALHCPGPLAAAAAVQTYEQLSLTRMHLLVVLVAGFGFLNQRSLRVERCQLQPQYNLDMMQLFAHLAVVCSLTCTSLLLSQFS